MLQKYKKPLLIFIGSLIILVCLVITFFLAFNYGRRSTYNKQVDLIPPTPSPTLFPTATTTYPTNYQKISPIVSPATSPTIAPSPIPTTTPKPTGTIFNIMPLVLFHPSETMVLRGILSIDGYRTSNNDGSTTSYIWVGRNNVATFRGFVSFDLKSLPGNITIEKAVLMMHQLAPYGHPYVIGGNVVVDHLDYGTSLDTTDYNRVAIKLHIGILSDNDTYEQKKLEVTDSVKNDLYYKRDRSQYRLRFATETIGGGSSGDRASFIPDDDVYQNAKSPQLEVTFRKN